MMMFAGWLSFLIPCSIGYLAGLRYNRPDHRRKSIAANLKCAYGHLALDAQLSLTRPLAQTDERSLISSPSKQ